MVRGAAGGVAAARVSARRRAGAAAPFPSRTCRRDAGGHARSDRGRGRPGARGAARVRPARARLSLRDVPQRPGRAGRAARPRRGRRTPPAAARCRPSGARRILDPRRAHARASGTIPRGVYHRARRRVGAAARARSGSARLPGEADQPARGAREDPPLGRPVAAPPGDRARLLTLLRDPHPAVHIAAVATLERVESAALATAALDRMPYLAPTVGAYYAGMLRRSRKTVLQLLLTRLRHTDDPALARLAEFAARLQEPALRESLTTLASHADAEVRTQVARALGAFPHHESILALTRLVGDAAWTVRAQAARSLGMLADPATLPLLHAALADPNWWVRLRSGLALTRFGSAGRNALLAAEVGADPGSRDMARLVLGLSPQALAEFAA